jgi:3-oxoadipate enol-lactonase
MSEGVILTGDGCRIAYRLDGAPGAPPLVLSNSLGTAMAMWEPQLPELVRRYTVVRYDSRGHGMSDAPPGCYSMDRLGRDVLELLDALGFGVVDFCGVSKGGMVGQWLGTRAPARIRRLVLANTSPYMGPPSSWDARIATVEGNGMAAVADAVLERWFTPRFRETANEAIAPLRGILQATSPVGYVGCCAAIRDMDLRPTLGLIELPTLVIGGQADTATPPEHARLLSGAIPGSLLTMLPAAHLSNIEQPAAFTKAILAHLSVPRRRAPP